MNTDSPKTGGGGETSPGQANKAATPHQFGTLEDLGLLHDPADPALRFSDIGMICPKPPGQPDKHCTRVM